MASNYQWKMLFKFIFPLVLLFTAVAAKTNQAVKNDCGQIPNFPKLGHNSKPLLRPAPGKPLPVNISVAVETVSIDEDKQEVEATLILRQEWKDPRLAFESEDKEEYRVIKNRKTIWTPDLFFSNGIIFEMDDDTKNISIKHFSDGRVLFSERKTVRTSCSANYREYPFDTLTCQLKIESYGHTVDDIIAQWNQSQKTAVPKRFIYDDFITSVTSEVCVNIFRGTAFTCLSVVFDVTRTPSAIIVRVILPVAIITICSWISFLVSFGENIMRVSLYLTPIVTYVMQINFCVAFFISPGYLTGLDLWVATASIAIVVSAVESIYNLFKKGSRNAAGEECEKPYLVERIALALFVSLLDVLSILSVFLSRLF